MQLLYSSSGRCINCKLNDSIGGGGDCGDVNYHQCSSRGSALKIHKIALGVARGVMRIYRTHSYVGLHSCVDLVDTPAYWRSTSKWNRWTCGYPWGLCQPSQQNPASNTSDALDHHNIKDWQGVQGVSAFFSSRFSGAPAIMAGAIYDIDNELYLHHCIMAGEAT